MKYRRLRIAWSVVWGLAAVLIVVLWVRSYWWMDAVVGQRGRQAFIVDSLGGVVLARTYPIPVSVPPKWHWGVSEFPIDESPMIATQRQIRNDATAGFAVLEWQPATYGVLVPYWFLVVLFAAPLITVWLPFRFTLRTLLIATALIAIVLGLIVLR